MKEFQKSNARLTLLIRGLFRMLQAQLDDGSTLQYGVGENNNYK